MLSFGTGRRSDVKKSRINSVVISKLLFPTSHVSHNITAFHLNSISYVEYHYQYTSLAF